MFSYIERLKHELLHEVASFLSPGERILLPLCSKSLYQSTHLTRIAVPVRIYRKGFRRLQGQDGDPKGKYYYPFTVLPSWGLRCHLTVLSFQYKNIPDFPRLDLVPRDGGTFRELELAVVPYAVSGLSQIPSKIRKAKIKQHACRLYNMGSRWDNHRYTFWDRNGHTCWLWNQRPGVKSQRISLPTPGAGETFVLYYRVSRDPILIRNIILHFGVFDYPCKEIWKTFRALTVKGLCAFNPRVDESFLAKQMALHYEVLERQVRKELAHHGHVKAETQEPIDYLQSNLSENIFWEETTEAGKVQMIAVLREFAKMHSVSHHVR